ncbi:MAG: electron transport complex subunit RsxD [Cycloclasticus sp. symbiont of Poecilosclerida sp. N]|nr:MAG: electron transport complex subunit RsxD [Cycloclasticus sp. symbiont of Poecilosclerida sp. N]
MHFLTSNSPFIAPQNSIQKMMLWLLIALTPGIFTMIWQFGYGVLFNIIICVSSAIAAEALMLYLRGRPIVPFISDLSAVVTALLLALALPTIAPWWIPFIGAFIAIVIAKHLYGGLGYNPFNPAMVAFAVLMISFPKSMTVWILPNALLPNGLSFSDIFAIVLNTQPNNDLVDAITAATPLDEMKTQLGLNQTTEEIKSASIFSSLAGQGWQWVSIAYLLGGTLLLFKKIISWHIPVGLLSGLFVISALFYLFEPGITPSPIFHLLGGGAILGAFFIATDPVTAATTLKGRFIYGVLIGVLTYIIRTWGGFPEGIAFAVILINMAVPLIDHYTQTRVYGHK